MEPVNESIQLPLEQALAALIPYLKQHISQDGPHDWDFLGIFPDNFLFLAGHAAETLPSDTTDFLAFIGMLPDWLTLRTNAIVPIRCELNTGGIADEKTRSAAIATHSQRVAALLQLFSRRYIARLKSLLNKQTGLDTRPWAGLGFSGYDLVEPPQDGKTPSGNSLIAKPAFVFEVFIEA